MYYHNAFVLGGFSIMDPRVVDDRTVNFYANYRGTVIHALAQIENCTDGVCSLEMCIRDSVRRAHGMVSGDGLRLRRPELRPQPHGKPVRGRHRPGRAANRLVHRCPCLLYTSRCV